MTEAARMALLRAAAAQPWAMEPRALEALMAQIGSGQLHAGLTAEAAATGQPSAALTPATERATARREGTVAVLSVDGVIGTRQTFMDWIMGINVIPPHAIAAAQEAAVADPEVKAVVTVYNTPGGVIGGVPEAFDRMFKLRGNGKPMVAVVSGTCASAGLWLASASEQLESTPTGLVGSLGVYMPHVDLSGAYEQAGVVKSYVEAPLGGYKTEGSDHEPLSDPARAHLQEMVNDIYGMFVRDVARGRGVSEAVARSEQFGQGRVYLANRAKDRGLIDKVRTLPETLAALGAGTTPKPTTSRGAYALAQAHARLRGIDV